MTKTDCFCFGSIPNFIKVSLSLFLISLSVSCNTSSEKPVAEVNELDGLKVPTGYTIEKIVDNKLISYPMFGIFDNDGRMFVFESDGSTPSTEDMLAHPTYHVRLLQDTDSNGIFDRSTIFADSLTIPKGGVFYKGSLYVTAAPDLLRITDTDNDGIADKREIIQTGWVLNHNAAILGGPFMGPDGYMYLTDARRGYDITSKEGKHFTGKGARIWRCKPDGTGLEPILGGGYDNAIELAFMPGGETIGTMTYFLDPQGGLRDALMHWVEGGVYPKPHAVIQEDKLKLTGDLMPVMTKLSRIAPSGLMRYHGKLWGDEFNGNLFSAEFNTGRIIRSSIAADGATFKTKDTAFITSTKEDMHPTDVFQDADGSLIIINTGGWFIAGCPLSRVAKLDVPGGIYRVRKAGAKTVDDAWGKRIDFKNLQPGEVVKFVNDPRVYVSQRAIQQLVDMGDNAVDAIAANILKSGDEETRAAAVFILGRIGSAKAKEAMAGAFDDASEAVRVAAARVAGLAKDANALPALQRLLAGNSLAARRQAAIAIEQIGDQSAAASLIKAAALSNDRVAEHAIIHALIMLKSPDILIGALNDQSMSVRKAALVALDQMDNSVLKKEHVIPYLESNNNDLVKTAIWVTSHHKEWADVVTRFLERKSNDSSAISDDAYKLFTQFSADPAIQQYISKQLTAKETNPESKKYYLDIIANSPVKNVPAVWVKALSGLLKDSNYEVVSQTLAVIQSRTIRSLAPQLHELVYNANVSPEIRLKALAAGVSADPLLTARDFGVLMSFMDSKHQPPVRQHAARILAGAELSSIQLKALAGKIPAVDAYLVPQLIQSFQGNMNAAVGQALISSLQKISGKLDNISEEELNKILKEYPLAVKTSAQPLIDEIKKKNAERLSQLQSTEASLTKGDIGNGRQLFFGKATCSSCHAINNEGSKFAPDLTNIGEIRSRHDILEAILFPSASFAREHETSKIIARNNTYTGIIKEQLPDAIVVATGPGSATRVQKSDITSIEPVNTSLMPPGLDKQLTQQELSDLVSYLVSLPDGAGGTIGF